MPFSIRFFEGNRRKTIHIRQDGSPTQHFLHLLDACGSIRRRRFSVLWTIFVILLVLWLLGFSFHVAGGLIHLLLVIAAVVLIVNLLTGRRAAL